MKKLKILALGDCNTLGIQDLVKNSYPERFSKKFDFEIINCGFTMSTTNEGKNFFDYYFDEDIDIIFIQYGLVDSWETFKYSPYVLYYPDNFLRKILRKIVKKYKKISKKIGLNTVLGTKNVVDINLYKRNIEYIISKSKGKKIFLIDTVPNNDIERNENIKTYNKLLDELVISNDNCYKVNLYEEFERNLKNYYLDPTHINNIGYEYITKELVKVYENSCN